MRAALWKVDALYELEGFVPTESSYLGPITAAMVKEACLSYPSFRARL